MDSVVELVDVDFGNRVQFIYGTGEFLLVDPGDSFDLIGRGSD